MQRIQCKLIGSDEGHFCTVYSEYPYEEVIFEPEEHRAMTPHTLQTLTEEGTVRINATDHPFDYVQNLCYTMRGLYYWATKAVVIEV